MASVKANRNSKGQIVSYRFRACIGRNDQGKQIFATKTVEPPAGLTPGKALKKMKSEANTWEEAVKKGYVPTTKLTFRRFVEEQFIPVHVESGKLSPSTQFFYKDISSRLVDYFGKKTLDSIKSLDIEKFLIKLKNTTITDKNGESKKYSTAYVQHFKTVLTVIFGFAERHDYLERNPMRKVDSVIKSDRTTVDFLTKDEAVNFLKLVEEDASLYWQLAMNILIFLGLRRGELVGLQWQDVDFSNSTLTINRDVICNKETGGKPLVKETKTANSDRTLPIPPTVMDLLCRWRKEVITQYGYLLPTAFIFANYEDVYSPVRPDNVTRWLRRFNTRHGLRQVSPHDLRHTAGTLLLSSGASVKEVQTILGHYDASVTLKYYCGTDLDSLKTASNRLESMLIVNQ